MKLVEKKCPSCGAQLSFGPKDKEAKCSYCKTEFIIEKENPSLEDLFDESNYMLNSLDMANVGKLTKPQKVVMIISLIIFFVFFGFIVYGGIKFQQNFDKERSSFDNKIQDNNIIDNNENKTLVNNTLEKYSDIDETTLNTFKSVGKDKLEAAIASYKEHFMPTIINSWEYVGSYFLHRTNNAKLYIIYKITYKIDGKNVDYYSTTIFNRLEKKNDKVTYSNIEINNPRKALKDIESTYGYESIEKLYNNLISNQEADYQVEKIDGLK